MQGKAGDSCSGLSLAAQEDPQLSCSSSSSSSSSFVFSSFFNESLFSLPNTDTSESNYSRRFHGPWCVFYAMSLTLRDTSTDFHPNVSAERNTDVR